MNPTTLKDDEFHDWIAHHLSYRHDWSSLLVHEHIQDTRDSVYGLIDLLETQIAERGDARPEWYKKTTGMLKMAHGRARQIERHIQGTGGSREKSQWKATLHQVVGLIVDRGSDELVEALEEIHIPVGGLNLGEWYDRRLEKREATVTAAIKTGNVDEFMVTGRDAA